MYAFAASSRESVAGPKSGIPGSYTMYCRVQGIVARPTPLHRERVVSRALLLDVFFVDGPKNNIVKVQAAVLP